MTWHDSEVPRTSAEASTFSPSDGSDIIVFHDSTCRWHRLPGTAGAIWATIDGRRTVATITDTVAAAYEVDPAWIRSDVATMLEGLLDRRLLIQPSIG